MKFVPVIVTVVPVPAEVGANETIEGGARYVKFAPLPVPWGVETDSAPVAPAPTTARMLVALTIWYELAATPPKRTLVAPVKFVPVIVTVAPVRAAVGLIDATVGGGK